QWERDRLLRSKELNTAGLPSRQLISLGYGVKGPSDVPAAKITAPAELNLGVYHDRLAATPAARSYAQEGRCQLRDARTVLTAHLKALVVLGMLRVTATNAPDRVLLCDPFGVVHLTHTQTDVTMYWRMTDDSATGPLCAVSNADVLCVAAAHRRRRRVLSLVLEPHHTATTAVIGV